MKRLGMVLTAAFAVTGLGQLPAVADDTVTVHGTDFPNPRAAQLTLVGCDSLYNRSTEFLQPYISRHTPLGSRSLKYDLGGGNGLGALSYVDSMRDTSAAGLQYYSQAGAQGVAYAGFQRPDVDGYQLWIGRAPLTSAGGWQTVDATSLTYTWAEYDMQTGQPTGQTVTEPATVAGFGAANGGDGAGFYMVGLGCDGAPFYMDGWRIGGAGTTTTYDIEALTTHLTMNGSTHSVDAGESVTLNGSLRDGAGRRLVRGTLILEAKPVGGRAFHTVQVVDAAASDPSVTLTPTDSMVYRWRFADRPLATASVSAEFRVDVKKPVTGEPEHPSLPHPTTPKASEPATTAPSTTAPTDEPSAPTTSETPSAEETTAPEVTVSPTATP